MDALAFGNWARQSGIELVTSLFAVEEGMHGMLFSEINKQWRNRGLRGWKDFRSSDRASFLGALSRGRSASAAFDRFRRQYVRLLRATRTFHQDPESGGNRISTYARGLLATYELDTMDAFHIAIARYARIDWAATSDDDWKQVPYINLFLPA
jgi:hypothetical protein